MLGFVYKDAIFFCAYFHAKRKARKTGNVKRNSYNNGHILLTLNLFRTHSHLSEMFLKIRYAKIHVSIPYQIKFVGQNFKNFCLVSKLLSDENLCPSKILSNISIQKSGKNRTKLSKFRLGVENFVRRNILSVENFVRRTYVR